MEIDISDMRSNYKTGSKNASELFWKITQNQSFESALAEELFNEIVRDCKIFGNEIWSAIIGLQNDAKGKENAHTERANRMNDDLRLLKAGDDYWNKADHSRSHGQERRYEHLAVYVGQQIDEIRGHIEIRNAPTEQALAKQFYEELKKFEQQRQQDEYRRRRADALMAKQLQAAEEKWKRAKGTDTQTIFDTQMEAIRNFHIVIPPRDNTPGIPMVGNQNHPPIPPTRPGATALRNNINERLDYLEYYSNIQQRLGSDTFSNRELAKELADNQATLIQNTAPTTQTMETISKRPTKRPPGAFDGAIKSDFTS
jgi:hypothetical protein